jgi:hypothetical protein
MIRIDMRCDCGRGKSKPRRADCTLHGKNAKRIRLLVGRLMLLDHGRTEKRRATRVAS